MKEIIPPVDPKLLLSELKDEYFVRPTNKAGNLIYDITAHDCPNVMREIARLREISYRNGGGSTGEEMDMDSMDTMEKPYRQLIVWNPEDQDIVGGYRYLLGKDVTFFEDGQPRISSAHLFHYSDYFIQEYLPHSVEFGRAFVQPKYTTREAGIKALFALDNIWDAIGALLHNNNIQYMFGKVTIYPKYDVVSRDLLFAYLHRYHNDVKGLYRPKNPLDICAESQRIADDIFEGDDAAANYHILQRAIRARGTVIPAMFSAYLNVTNNIQYFGSAYNDELSNVIETGILVKIDEVYEEKKLRYIAPYIEYLKTFIATRKQRRNK